MTILLAALGVATVGFGSAVAWVLWASAPQLSPLEYMQGQIASLPNTRNEEALQGPPGTFRLATLNAGYAFGPANNTATRVPKEQIEANLDALGRALASLHADFIVLQEVDFDSDRTYRIDQLAWIQRHTGHPHMAIAYNWDVRYLPWPYWPPAAHFGRILSGQALLSRVPIRGQKKIAFPKPDTQPFWYNRFFLDRALHLCTVEIDGAPLLIGGCHLESYHPASRRAQARLLAAALQEEAGTPIVLAGDFNAIPDWAEIPPRMAKELGTASTRDDSLTYLEQIGLRPLFSAARWATRGEESHTYASFAPMACIDHVFVGGALAIVDGGVCRDSGEASDHFPVWVDCALGDTP